LIHLGLFLIKPEKILKLILTNLNYEKANTN
jgi:hypothetical protein